jgi:hypothetical protein
METPLTADQARQLSIKKQLTLEQALIQIKSMAEYGQTSNVFCGCIPSEETRMELMRLGYNLRISKDQLGVEVFICSW